MKILSRPEGDGLLTNAEVHEWLKEKNFAIQRRDVPEGVIKPPSATYSIARHLLRYLETTPSGAQSTKSARLMFERLKRFNLSNPELMMIANIRPEAYAHLTVLIPNVHSRYDDDQIYEILEIVNNTLEKRVKQKSAGALSQDADQKLASHEQLDHEEIPPAELGADTTDHAMTDEIPVETVDMTAAVQPDPLDPQEVRETGNPTDVTDENGLDATTTDYSIFAETSKPDIQSADKRAHRMTR